MSDVVSLWIDRQTKLLKRYTKRYVSFSPSTRKISYGEDESKGPKATMILTKVTRCCEIMEVKPAELMSIIVDGTHEDGKEDQWTLRLADRASFDSWYKMMCNACAAAGLMDPYNFGLPDVDPRTNVPFISVPLEYMFKFALLEKAILHYFGIVNVVTSNAKETHNEHVLVISDRNVYLFRMTADVVRCSPINTIVKMFQGEDATFMAIQMKGPAQDLVVKDFTGSTEVAGILKKLYSTIARKKLSVMPINVPTAELLIESQQLRLDPDEGYKLNVVSPTAKLRLRQALDVHQRTAGSSTTATKGSAKSSSKRDSVVSGSGSKASGSGAKSSRGGASGDEDKDPLYRLLKKVGMEDYADALINQHVDIDVLQCMDQADLKNFGVLDDSHCKCIIDAALNRSLVDQVTGESNTSGTAMSSNSPLLSIGSAKPQSGAPVLLSDDDLGIPLTTQSQPRLTLEDSDDDDLLLAPKKGPGASPAKAPISLDDDDDL